MSVHDYVRFVGGPLDGLLGHVYALVGDGAIVGLMDSGPDEWRGAVEILVEDVAGLRVVPHVIACGWGRPGCEMPPAGAPPDAAVSHTICPSCRRAVFCR